MTLSFCGATHLVTPLAVPIEGIVLLILAFHAGPVVGGPQLGILLVVALLARVTTTGTAGRPRRTAGPLAGFVVLDLAHQQMVKNEILETNVVVDG